MIGSKTALFSIVLVVCASQLAGGAAQASPRFCIRSGTMRPDDKIQISGTLFEQLFYGPPNFGETPKIDKKGESIILRLDDPLRVDRKDSGTKTSTLVVRQIQVALMGDLYKTQYPPLRGRHVIIGGNLYPQQTGYHIRPVLISADTMRLGGRIGCDGREAPQP